jgi:penicillin-binding protein 1C
MQADDGGPEIVAPLDGASVVLGDGALLLIGRGGRPPYQWLVDGRPAAQSVEPQTLWRPDGLGAAKIELVDAAGRTAAAAVWIERLGGDTHP